MVVRSGIEVVLPSSSSLTFSTTRAASLPHYGYSKLDEVYGKGSIRSSLLGSSFFLYLCLVEADLF